MLPQKLTRVTTIAAKTSTAVHRLPPPPPLASDVLYI